MVLLRAVRKSGATGGVSACRNVGLFAFRATTPRTRNRMADEDVLAGYGDEGLYDYGEGGVPASEDPYAAAVAPSTEAPRRRSRSRSRERDAQHAGSRGTGGRDAGPVIGSGSSSSYDRGAAAARRVGGEGSWGASRDNSAAPRGRFEDLPRRDGGAGNRGRSDELSRRYPGGTGGNNNNTGAGQGGRFGGGSGQGGPQAGGGGLLPTPQMGMPMQAGMGMGGSMGGGMPGMMPGGMPMGMPPMGLPGMAAMAGHHMGMGYPGMPAMHALGGMGGMGMYGGMGMGGMGGGAAYAGLPPSTGSMGSEAAAAAPPAPAPASVSAGGGGWGTAAVTLSQPANAAQAAETPAPAPRPAAAPAASAEPPSEPPADVPLHLKKTLRVADLDPELCTLPSLSMHFSTFGKVTNVMVARKAGEAYVQFVDHKTAAAAKAGSADGVCGDPKAKVSWARHDPQAPEGAPPAPAPAPAAVPSGGRDVSDRGGRGGGRGGSFGGRGGGGRGGYGGHAAPAPAPAPAPPPAPPSTAALLQARAEAQKSEATKLAEAVAAQREAITALARDKPHLSKEEYAARLAKIKADAAALQAFQERVAKATNVASKAVANAQASLEKAASVVAGTAPPPAAGAVAVGGVAAATVGGLPPAAAMLVGSPVGLPLVAPLLGLPSPPPSLVGLGGGRTPADAPVSPGEAGEGSAGDAQGADDYDDDMPAVVLTGGDDEEV